MSAHGAYTIKRNPTLKPDIAQRSRTCSSLHPMRPPRDAVGKDRRPKKVRACIIVGLHCNDGRQNRLNGHCTGIAPRRQHTSSIVIIERTATLLRTKKIISTRTIYDVLELSKKIENTKHGRSRNGKIRQFQFPRYEKREKLLTKGMLNFV
jgi:hypothetical protein